MERYLETLGVSAIAEWDVLAFLQRHGTTIANAAQVAHLVGYSQSVVESALHKLTRGNLIQCSRGSNGIRLYAFVPLDTPARQECLGELMKMADGRNGRLALIRALGQATRGPT
jgi:DNA-binding MarR family transcriptional regulator